MRTKTAALIGIIAALGLALGLGSSVTTGLPAQNAPHQVLANDVGPHVVRP
ncbi:hypothetical protein ACIPPM_25240 [Streptomyces sp. NPDC090119]|uniref:hypothetical protein n=1 Tax=Streptomyces sp. NPDC090119 TaxID=3365951 RepID=UPI0037FA7A9B